MFGIGLGAAAAYLALRPARMMNAWLHAGNNSQAHVRLGWSYSEGMRPVSVVFDVAVPGGRGGSLTVDGEEHDGTIALAAPLSGPYTITASAVYRILGSAHHQVHIFNGTL
jgi:hypothetical protein